MLSSTLTPQQRRLSTLSHQFPLSAQQNDAFYVTAPSATADIVRRVNECSASSSSSKSKSPALTLSSFPYHLRTSPSATRFNDCDMYGHVNNVVYYSYIDTIVNQYLMEECSMDTSGTDPHACIGLVVSSSCVYKKSLVFPQRFISALRVRKIGETSVQYEIGIFGEELNEGVHTGNKHELTPAPTTTDSSSSTKPPSYHLSALSQFTHVFVRRDTMRPMRVPPEIRAGLEKVLVKVEEEDELEKKMQMKAATMKQQIKNNNTTSSSPLLTQSASHVLMVSPLHFRRNPETAQDNAFMNSSSLTDAEISKRAMREFDGYVRELRKHGVEVTVVQPSPHCITPDSVYPNNWFSTHQATSATSSSTSTHSTPSRLILYPMRHHSRRLERDPSLINTLRTQYTRLHDLTSYEETSSSNPKSLIFEGTGTGIIDHVNERMYYCKSERANDEEFVRGVVGKSIWPQESNAASSSRGRIIPFSACTSSGSAHYHTNVMMSLGTRWCVLCAESITNEKERQVVIQSLKETGHDVILITQSQVESFCGNILEVRNNKGKEFVVMSTRAYGAFTEEQRKRLETHVDGGLIKVDLRTIEEIGGGGARCMIAELF